MTTADQLIVLYVGDFDPRRMSMSEVDLPNRFSKYGGDHVTLRRIALTRDAGERTAVVPGSRQGSEAGKNDPRYKWFVRNYGDRCWELDAMDPERSPRLRRAGDQKLIEPVAWKRCESVNQAEQESLKTILEKWKGKKTFRWRDACDWTTATEQAAPRSTMTS